MLLSDYFWGELSLWWYAPFNRIISPHLHISAERLESKNLLHFLPPTHFNLNLVSGRVIGLRLTYASHNGAEDFFFYLCYYYYFTFSFHLSFIFTLFRTQKEWRNEFESFPHSFYLFSSLSFADDNFPLFSLFPSHSRGIFG